MVLTGIQESFAPGTNEYKRTTLDMTKNKYYDISRTSLLFVGGFGTVPGAQMTADQGKATIRLESRVEDQLTIEIMTHDPRLTLSTTFVTGSLPTGVYGTAGTYSVADASILRPYDLIKNMTTGELLLITAVNTGASPDEITAYPAFESSNFSGKTSFPASLTNGTPQAKTNGDVIQIIGTAFPEGSTQGNIIDSQPTVALNYMQIFREDYGVTYEEMNTTKNGLMALADKEERAKADLLLKMERAILDSKINEQSTNSGTVRSMQGIKGTVSTYNQAASALVGGGNDITVPKLDEIGEQIAGGINGNRAIGLVSGKFIRKLRELMDGKVETKVVVGSEDFGIKALRYESALLTFDFVHHDYFDIVGNSDEALFFSPNNYELVNLKNADLGKVSEKKGIAGGLAANDKMAMQDALYGAYTLDYRNEKGSALITGLVHTISS